jgi:dihydroorotate dehydrogenase electron transfer subunit
MQRVELKIKYNRQLIPNIYEMCLEGDVSDIRQPGQFVNVAVDKLYLRRPLSVCDYNEHELTLLYKVVGRGTTRLSLMHEGQEVDILSGLGNGFTTDVPYSNILLAGGGIGIAPLYKLAKELKSRGKKLSVALCFNTDSEIFYDTAFKEIGLNDVYIVTVDGSRGHKGFVTDLIRQQQQRFGYFYACGPMPMLKALCQEVNCPGEVSLEARMGCGFGICMGCSIETTKGSQRICKEGPVFKKEDVVW